MFRKTEKPAACEMWSVFHFLNARNMKPADIHCRLCEVYGEHTMSDLMVCKNVHDDPRNGRPSVVNEDLVRAMELRIQENRRLFTIS
jgi:hypothetical protein